MYYSKVGLTWLRITKILFPASCEILFCIYHKMNVKQMEKAMKRVNRTSSKDLLADTTIFLRGQLKLFIIQNLVKILFQQVRLENLG